MSASTWGFAPPETIPCGECDGEGALTGWGAPIAGYNSVGAPFPTEYRDRCQECGGTGEARCVYCGEAAATVEWVDGPACADCVQEGEE